MAAPRLLGFTPLVSSPSVLDGEWDVTAEIDDPTERLSGFDVEVGDIVFVDLLSSTAAPGTAGRYTISLILTQTATSLRAVLRWGGNGDPVDPVEGAGHRGYLSSPSEQNSLAWMPSARTMLLPVELVEAAKNTETYAIIDKFASTISGTVIDQVARDRQVRAVSTLRTFSLGQVVCMRGEVPDLACPQDDLKMPAAGIALGMGAGKVVIQSFGTVSNAAFNFRRGLPLFVSDIGTLTQDPETVTRPGWLQPCGVAYEPTIISLAFFGVATRRS